MKDFPGSWAEYRVFEGGILQVHRRLSSSAALAWSEKCPRTVLGDVSLVRAREAGGPLLLDHAPQSRDLTQLGRHSEVAAAT